MNESRQLLVQYATDGSEAAFHEVVTRYVNLVYSAALRLVEGDRHLAEDVTQTVFADLARQARSLSREVMLGGWLHRHTCFVASKTLRTERRRRERERQVVEMNASEDHSAENLAQVAPVLDEAINELAAEDRTAILLRFFEQHDFAAVGAALGSSEEAARKRVDRALDKLESLLKRRGVAFSATALAATLTAQAVTAAPAGLALTVSTVAVAGAATGAGTTLTIVKIMSMTKMKLAIAGIIVVAGVGIPLMVIQQRSQMKLREAEAAIKKQADQNLVLAAENARLAAEKERAEKSKPASETPSSEVLKLRSKVGKLQQTASEIAASKTNGPSMLSGLTADPNMRKLIRDQQKAGMGMIYKEFAKRAKLPTEQDDKLADLLADDVMDNIDRITEVLRDGKGPAEMEQVFASQETALQEKVKALLGPEGFTAYQDFTKNLASHLTAEQFKTKLGGDKDAKDTKAKQIYEAMQQETAQALTAAGLAVDYQTVPSLNFRNFASEAEAEKNLKLLDGIYEKVAARSSAFLSPDEVGKFAEFRTNAINANRMALTLNRKMMGPGAK